jgi:transposase
VVPAGGFREEHRAVHLAGYGYSSFCELYRAWEARLSPTMRQSHVAGERLFVDYAGTTLEVIDASTGVAKTVQLFVAALGASSYTYAEATWTQGLSDWIGSHTRAWSLIGGAPAMVVSNCARISPSLLLRAGGQPHLRRDGGPLKHRHCADAAVSSPRQGQGGSGVRLAPVHHGKPRS